jgi:hypothetical protein
VNITILKNCTSENSLQINSSKCRANIRLVPVFTCEGLDEQKDRETNPYPKWTSTHLLALLNPASNGAIILQRTIPYNKSMGPAHVILQPHYEKTFPFCYHFRGQPADRTFLRSSLLYYEDLKLGILDQRNIAPANQPRTKGCRRSIRGRFHRHDRHHGRGHYIDRAYSDPDPAKSMDADGITSSRLPVLRFCNTFTQRGM